MMGKETYHQRLESSLKWLQCKVSHDWHTETAPATGPLFRICRRCDRYEDAIPESVVIQAFKFKKITPGTITQEVYRLRLSIINHLENPV